MADAQATTHTGQSFHPAAYPLHRDGAGVSPSPSFPQMEEEVLGLLEAGRHLQGVG